MKREETKMARFIGVYCIVLIGLISLQGCAKPAGKTDFLASPVELKPCPESKEKLWWERPDFNWHSYKKVIIDPIAVVGDAAGGESAPDRADILKLEQYFQKSVTEKLAPEFAVVREPGTDVLRIRPAITRVERVKPLVNALTTVALFIPLDMGGASIEVEFLDSLTGERLAAMVETKSGTPLQLIASLSRYGHAENAMDDWASELKSALVDNP